MGTSGSTQLAVVHRLRWKTASLYLPDMRIPILPHATGDIQMLLGLDAMRQIRRQGNLYLSFPALREMKCATLS